MLRSDEAVGRADPETALRQKLLQFVTLLGGQHPFVARPGMQHRAAAAHAVGQIAGAERVSLGGIVFHDDAEILQDQKSRTARIRPAG